MTITIDTDTQRLRISEADGTREYPLFAPESFRILSRQWLAMGWNLEHWTTVFWKGRQALQLPDDLLRLAEMLWRVRPDLMVETGVYQGGSAAWFAEFCRVIAVERDVLPGVRKAVGDRVTIIEGNSAATETAMRVAAEICAGERVCVFLDSDHSASHVAAELRNYAGLVSSGSYLIVADSILPEFAATPCGDAAWEHDHPGIAVDRFLAEHPEFTRELPSHVCQEVSYFSRTWLRRA
jgi:cephalosporin hydroxylase